MSTTKDGFVLRFTQPVAKGWLEKVENYEMAQWTYMPKGQYGGPKIDEHDLKVTAAVAAEDGKSVTLTVPNRKLGYCIKLTVDPVSKSGKAIWSGDLWYTLNRLPK